MASKGTGGASGLEQAQMGVDIAESLFGGSSTVTGSGSGTSSKFSTTDTQALDTSQVAGSGTGRSESFLEIDKAGIDQIMKQILGGTQGLASIFGADKASGFSGSSVSGIAGGNLLASLAGEIAKLTAKKVSTTEEETSEESGSFAKSLTGQRGGEDFSSSTDTTTDKQGLLDRIF